MSQAVLAGFLAVHHALLALAKDEPELRPYAEKSVRAVSGGSEESVFKSVLFVVDVS